MPDLKADEHFQVWMRTAGLPSFRKLYGRVMDPIPGGVYTVSIESSKFKPQRDFNVQSYKGTKSVVISTTSWIGGKNVFLGIAYITVGAISLFSGFAFLLKHLLYPRRLGDHQYLSWNKSNGFSD
jgi:hypothetical protein